MLRKSFYVGERTRSIAFLTHAFLLLAACGLGSLQSATYAQDGIRVMTYNIRYNTASDKDDAWPHRADKVAETIQLADVIGLQEARKEQIDDLVVRLPEFSWVGVGRDDGKEEGEFVPIFYRKDRFKILSSDNFWLSETPAEPGSKSWDTAITRMVTWVVFQDESNQQRFVHMNTHFDHMGKQARLESAKLIRSKAAKTHLALPLVLTGDFNCTPDQPPYLEIVRESDGATDFVDSLAAYTPKPGEPAGTWNGFKEIETTRIDYIFTSRGATSTETKILDPRTEAGRFASDHQPILSTVQIPRP